MRAGEKMIVAVGSTRRPKLEAVREAMVLLAPRLAAGCAYEVVGVEVASGVGHTPLSREETLLGARQRAEALVEMNDAHSSAWTYFVGLEGGLDVTAPNGASASTTRQQRLVFLQNWAYVTDGRAGAFGQSGGVALPEALARMVVDDGVELAQAIDAFAGQHGIRDGQGAWGILTGGLITRQDAFRIAVINAFAPFLNGTAYAAAATQDASPR